MKDRIKEIRKHFKKTQSEFGADLHITKSAIQSYEYGTINMSDRTISDICRIYNVNETWLRTGSGDMFSPVTEEQKKANMVSAIIKNDNKVRDKLIDIVVQMSDEEIELFYKIACKLADGEI